MAPTALKRWTLDEFFAWQERQDARYELVDGEPLRMMSGASNRHDRVVVNLLRELSARLRGKPCRPFTADGAVQTRPGQIRRPDAGVDCGRSDPNGYVAAEVRLVAEVLSPSTRDFDTYGKLAEYRALETLRTILVIEPNAPEITVWSRDDQGRWSDSAVSGLDETVDIPDLGIALPLAEIYDGVEFPERFHYTTR